MYRKSYVSYKKSIKFTQQNDDVEDQRNIDNIRFGIFMIFPEYKTYIFSRGDKNIFQNRKNDFYTIGNKTNHELAVLQRAQIKTLGIILNGKWSLGFKLDGVAPLIADPSPLKLHQ